MRIDPSADRRAAQREFAQMLPGSPQPADAVLDLARVAAELLPQPNRRGIREMGPADFQNRIKFLCLFLQGLLQFFQSRQQVLDDPIERRDVNGRWDHVVAGLSSIDVIVRMNRFVAAFATQQLAGAVGNHLVRVHVRRSAGPRLENIYDKLAVPFAFDDFLRRFLNCHRDVLRQQPQRRIADGSVLFD